MADFTAYVRKDKLPATAAIIKANASRGFKVELGTDQPLDTLNGMLPLKVDDQAIEVKISVQRCDSPEFQAKAEALEKAGDETSSTLARAIRTTHLALTFSGESETANHWSRDLARSTAILAIGAFHNPEHNKVLYYGR